MLMISEPLASALWTEEKPVMLFTMPHSSEQLLTAELRSLEDTDRVLLTVRDDRLMRGLFPAGQHCEYAAWQRQKTGYMIIPLDQI